MSARPRLRHGAALAHMTQAGIEVAKMFLEPIFKTPGQQMGNVAKMTLVMIVHDIANGVQQLFVVLLELFLQREVGRYIGCGVSESDSKHR